MSPVPTISPPLRRRGLAAAAATAGAGAAVALLALSSTAPTSVAALAPTSGSARTSPAQEAVSLPAVRGVPRAAYPKVRLAAAQAATKATSRKALAAAPRATSSAKSCAGMSSTVDAFLQHVYAAHLEASPGQQAADIGNVDQYVTTHTVMLENMLEPLVGGGGSALDSFLQHVYAAHLEASPGQQVADIADIDQYAATHTVMLENMLEPLAGGSC